MQQPYRILGLKSGASQAEVKNAYRKLAKKYHPDISKEPDAENRFIEVSEAYEILTGGVTVSHNVTDVTNVFNSEVSARTREELRKERARAFARMRYETFKKNNEAFHKSWYFGLVKAIIYLLIAFFYCIAGVMLLAPLIV